MEKKQQVVYIVIGLLICFFVVMGIYKEPYHKDYIRFHVIANSDSPLDQALKLKVRDRLLDELGEEFYSVDSAVQGRQKIRGKLPEIRDIVLQEIARNQMSYPVAVQFGRFIFPTKAYGKLVLPAGEYEALRVVIGQGKGSNWWCVMFPPLCFVDITHGVASEPAQQTQNADTKMEQKIDLQNQDEYEEEMEYKWKMAEWWQESKPRMIRIFSFLGIIDDT